MITPFGKIKGKPMRLMEVQNIGKGTTRWDRDEKKYNYIPAIPVIFVSDYPKPSPTELRRQELLAELDALDDR